jgi:hypothetical protein
VLQRDDDWRTRRAVLRRVEPLVPHVEEAGVVLQALHVLAPDDEELRAGARRARVFGVDEVPPLRADGGRGEGEDVGRRRGIVASQRIGVEQVRALVVLPGAALLGGPWAAPAPLARRQGRSAQQPTPQRALCVHHQPRRERDAGLLAHVVGPPLRRCLPPMVYALLEVGRLQRRRFEEGGRRLHQRREVRHALRSRRHGLRGAVFGFRLRDCVAAKRVVKVVSPMTPERHGKQDDTADCGRAG